MPGFDSSDDLTRSLDALRDEIEALTEAMSESNQSAQQVQSSAGRARQAQATQSVAGGGFGGRRGRARGPRGGVAAGFAGDVFGAAASSLSAQGLGLGGVARSFAQDGVTGRAGQAITAGLFEGFATSGLGQLIDPRAAQNVGAFQTAQQRLSSITEPLARFGGELPDDQRRQLAELFVEQEKRVKDDARKNAQIFDELGAGAAVFEGTEFGAFVDAMADFGLWVERLVGSDNQAGR